MKYTQDNPYLKCHRPYRCGQATCSIECRNYAAYKESRALQHILRRARRMGVRIYTGNANFGSAIEPKQVSAVVSRFGKSLPGKWRFHLEPSSAEGRLHLHFIVITEKAITEDYVRRAWSQALGNLCSPRKTSITFGNARRVKAVAKYVSGDTKPKGRTPLFAKHLPFRTKGGSLRFFSLPLNKLYRDICRWDMAWRLAKLDSDILEHPTWEYYLAWSDTEYAKSTTAT